MDLKREPGFVPPGMTEAWLAARTVEEGECLIWTGQADNGGRDPRCTVDSIKNVNVRRVLFAMFFMRPVREGWMVVAGCKSRCCVLPEHLCEVPRGWGQRKKPKSIWARARIAAGKRRSSNIPQSIIPEIHASPLPGKAEAARLRALGIPISKDMVNKIRNGTFRQDYNLGTPFALLGIR